MSAFSKYLARNKLDTQSHQTAGVEWCVGIETTGIMMGNRHISSGILADEMGLGKTIQMIGLMLTNFKLNTLIVLPRALLEQWESVIVTTLGHTPLVYHGAEASRVSLQELSSAPIVLTTYGMLSKGLLLCEMTWDRIIFDEAHHLRNRKTRCHLAAVHIRASHKWLVTGTPIQNNITDFYGLCAVLGISQPFYINRRNMASIVERLILKRTKADAGIVLPTMKRTNVLVKWETEEEKQIAEDIHSTLSFSKITGSGDGGLHYFAVLQQARQSCIDMRLVDESLLEEYQSKINKVVEIIVERKDNGAAKLIFCHYRAEIDKIKILLAGAGMAVGSFDGRTTQSERRDIIGKVDLDALVLQINTGCEGLNLQYFSEVYFVAPHWNPAVEDQAVARSYRIGQEKPVSVFSFRMESFEDSQTMDGYVKRVQRVKRDEMECIDHPDPDDFGPELLCADGDSDKCAICLAEQHKHTTTCLDCGHCFHKTCINSWFERSMTCPTCRQ